MWNCLAAGWSIRKLQTFLLKKQVKSCRMPKVRWWGCKAMWMVVTPLASDGGKEHLYSIKRCRDDESDTTPKALMLP
ncbi:hypothetical protein ALQ62_200012 [Pseudomonas coronafaciens pv. zizaniae]|nr:hypothetical protein ALQ62_200012 [Pseudomonas coronafaciens pv. zizaniae]